MTTLYLVRHAEPNYNNHDDMNRELSARGLEDRKKVTQFLKDKDVNIIVSSPYKRAIDTVKDFADWKRMSIEIIQDLRERRVDSQWIEDFTAFTRKQWEDFDYKLSDGESLREVQNRNISAIEQLLEKYRDKNIVVGSHGTALSTIINYYDSSFGYEAFETIKYTMPWIVRFKFQENDCIEIKSCYER